MGCEERSDTGGPLGAAAASSLPLTGGELEPSGAPATSPVTPASDLFRTDHLRADLKARTIRGGVITVTSQGVKFVLNMVSTMTLARLLTPAEFGLVAMVAPITGFIAFFKDMGLSMATVQREDITHEQVSTLFWINVTVSVFLALVAAAISPLVGWFYHDVRTAWITIAVAGTFIFGGLTAQHGALLNRNMRFGVMAGLDIANNVAGLAAGIVTALLGWSYWSLVAMSFASGITGCVGVWIMSPWRPGAPKRGAGTRALLRFGGGMTAANIMGYFCTQIDKILLSRFYYPPGYESMSMAQITDVRSSTMGVYTRALSLFVGPLVQVLAPLNAVIVPLFSRLAGDRRRLSATAILIIEFVSAAFLPVAILSFVCAEDVISILLGRNPAWALAAPFLRAFSIVALTMPAGAVINVLLISTGRSDVILKWETFWFVFLIVAMGIGLLWGPLGIAIAAGWGGFVVAPLHFYIATRVAGLEGRRIGVLVLRNAITASVCVVALLLLRPALRDMPALSRLAVNTAVIALAHGCLLWAFGTVQRARDLFRSPQRQALGVVS